MNCNFENRTPAAYATMQGKKHIVPRQNTIYWHIVNFTDDTTKYKTILAFFRAFAILEKYFGGIIFEATSNKEAAQIKILFTHNENQEIKQPSLFDEGVLAHAYPWTGEIFFNEAYNWDEMHKEENNSWNLAKVAVHEILHTLYIAHSTVADDIMFPQGKNDNIINITQDTKDAIKFLYGQYFQKENSLCIEVNSLIDLVQNFTFQGIKSLSKKLINTEKGKKRELAEQIFTHIKK